MQKMELSVTWQEGYHGKIIVQSTIRKQWILGQFAGSVSTQSELCSFTPMISYIWPVFKEKIKTKMEK